MHVSCLVKNTDFYMSKNNRQDAELQGNSSRSLSVTSSDPALSRDLRPEFSLYLTLLQDNKIYTAYLWIKYLASSSFHSHD